MTVFARILRPAAAQVAADARLRRGVWLALGVALCWCVLVQSDRLGVAREDYASTAGRLKKAETSLRRRDWPELLAAARETNREIVSAFWRAETEGLAQAELQAALAGLFDGLGLRDVRIRSGASARVPDLPDMLRVRTVLDAAYRPGTEYRMLHAVATYPRKLIVDRLELAPGADGEAWMALAVSSYFVGVGAGEPD